MIESVPEEKLLIFNVKEGWEPLCNFLELPIPNDLDSVSSSQARMGTTGLLLQAALDFDQLTGAWTDPSRYERWLAENVADN